MAAFGKRLHPTGPFSPALLCPKAASMAAEPNSKQHILAVNNDADVLALLRELLEEEGYHVSTQSYVLQNLDEVVRLAPDAIILDYMWAEEDAGWSMLEMLRLNRQTSQIPIVLCTGAARAIEELEGHLTEMGVKVVLKPFDIDHLLNVLSEVLGRPQSA